jgi:hypothetical protein
MGIVKYSAEFKSSAEQVEFLYQISYPLTRHGGVSYHIKITCESLETGLSLRKRLRCFFTLNSEVNPRPTFRDQSVHHFFDMRERNFFISLNLDLHFPGHSP